MSECPSCENGRVELTLSEVEKNVGHQLSTVARLDDGSPIGWPVELCLNPFCKKGPFPDLTRNI